MGGKCCRPEQDECKPFFAVICIQVGDIETNYKDKTKPMTLKKEMNASANLSGSDLSTHNSTD